MPSITATNASWVPFFSPVILKVHFPCRKLCAWQPLQLPFWRVAEALHAKLSPVMTWIPTPETNSRTTQAKLQITCKVFNKPEAKAEVKPSKHTERDREKKKKKRNAICLTQNKNLLEQFCIGKKINYHRGDPQSFRVSSQGWEPFWDCRFFL